MALASSLTIVRMLSAFHLTVAFYLIANPAVIADQNLVFLLGESMHLPRAYSFERPSAATALLGLLFALLGIGDFTASAMAEPVAVEYWGSQVPVRLAFFFGLTGYTYLSKPRAAVAWQRSSGAVVKNGLTFTWAFLELLMWFWVYLQVRGERRVVARRRGHGDQR